MLEAATGADIVILAVKPWLIRVYSEEMKLRSKQILVSVAAGISFEQLAHGGRTWNANVRIVPNVSVNYRAWHWLLREMPARIRNAMVNLFSEMGMAMICRKINWKRLPPWLPCGIAYVLKYIRAAMQAGIEMESAHRMPWIWLPNL